MDPKMSFLYSGFFTCGQNHKTLNIYPHISKLDTRQFIVRKATDSQFLNT